MCISYHNAQPPSTGGQPKCWPKFKVRLLERAKLDSFGRAKLDTLSSRKGRGAELIFRQYPIGQAITLPNLLFSDYASMLRCRAWSEPMSQKDARHDGIRRIGTLLDARRRPGRLAVATRRSKEGRLLACGKPLRPEVVDLSAADAEGSHGLLHRQFAVIESSDDALDRFGCPNTASHPAAALRWETAKSSVSEITKTDNQEEIRFGFLTKLPFPCY